MGEINKSMDYKSEILKDLFNDAIELFDSKDTNIGFIDRDLYKDFSIKYDLDIWFVVVAVTIFRGLPEPIDKNFIQDCIEIIPVGANFNLIKSEWHKTILTDQLRFAERGSEKELAIKRCIKVFEVDFKNIDFNSANYASIAASKVNANSASWAASAATGTTKSAVSLRKYKLYEVFRDTSEDRLKAILKSVEVDEAFSSARSLKEAAKESQNWLINRSYKFSKEARLSSKEAYYFWLSDQFLFLLKSLKTPKQSKFKNWFDKIVKLIN